MSVLVRDWSRECSWTCGPPMMTKTPSLRRQASSRAANVNECPWVWLVWWRRHSCLPRRDSSRRSRLRPTHADEDARKGGRLAILGASSTERYPVPTCGVFQRCVYANFCVGTNRIFGPKALFDRQISLPSPAADLLETNRRTTWPFHIHKPETTTIGTKKNRVTCAYFGISSNGL